MGNPHALFVLLLFALLAGIAFAQMAPSVLLVADWQVFAWWGFLIAALFIGLAYMAAKLLENPAIEAWVRIEAGELFISLIIIVLLLSLNTGANALTQMLTGDPSYQAAANSYLEEFRNAAGDLYNRMAEVSFRVNKAVGFSFSASYAPFDFISFTASAAPRSGMGELLGAVNNAMDSLSLTILFLEAQRLFLIFFLNAAVITFPLGIVLRTFPLTRKLGAVVLAAAVATAVVYPLGLVVSKQIYNAYSPSILEKAVKLPDQVPDIGRPSVLGVSVVELYCDPLMQQFTSAFGMGEVFYDFVICTPACALTLFAGPVCFETCKRIVEGLYHFVTTGFSAAMMLPLSHYVTKVDAEAYFNAVNDTALPAITNTIVLSIVLSLLPIIASVVMLRSLAVAFGGDAQLYGLYKIL
jgi:hypothetical protein